MRLTTALWDGYAMRECGEHRSTGDRAWCFTCSEWCYETIPCKGCELPVLRELAAELALHLKALCEHPVNYEDRYNAAAGRPCPGCYDAVDRYERFVAPAIPDSVKETQQP